MPADANEDDRGVSVTVSVIRDLIRRVEEYEQRSAAELSANLVQLRKDFHFALSPLQLDNIDHRRAHDADRIERTTRQESNDRNFADIRRDIRILSLMIAATLALIITVAAIVIVRLG